jgi:hypothetical protein
MTTMKKGDHVFHAGCSLFGVLHADVEDTGTGAKIRHPNGAVGRYSLTGLMPDPDGKAHSLTLQLREVDKDLAHWAVALFKEGETVDAVEGRIRSAMAVVEASRPDPEHEQLFKDTLTNWGETSFGLWAQPITRRCNAELELLECTVRDAEDDSEPEHRVTLDTVRTGFARIRSGEVKGLHESRVAHIAGAYAANDACMIDADDSDIVVQAGLFNEIIYG